MALMKPSWDSLGIAASVVCAIHCAVLPLIFTSLPLLGFNILHNAYFEFGMIFLAMGIGIVALRHGFKLHHHSRLPTALLVIGFAGLFAKEFFPKHLLLLLLPSVACIIAAHIINYRLCRKANHCHPNDCKH
ncbi:MAG: MerC domain-containing protein [Bacteroidetes bacterium]|nr:MAG: MerC domain-containing protein [Bacteroidota bacterium]